MVAGYYLFLCLVGFAILLGPTGSNIPVNLIGNEFRDEHEIATPNLGTDPTDCSVCHPDEYGNWSTTPHATHMNTYNATHVRIGSFLWMTWAVFNASCSECHTSGWDNSTGTPSYEFLGVNCFACHNGTPTVDYSGTNCGDCHRATSEEHPNQLLPYLNSAHVNSLTDLRSSGHATSACMHCMSTEGFIDQAGTYDPQDVSFSPVACPACHSVHSDWSAGAGMIRANSTSELCGTCHVGSKHTTYQTWVGGPHALAGVECIDCHGYDVAPGDNVFLNHTFVVKPDLACGQAAECHMGLEDWAINQLETYQASYEDLTVEILAEANAFEPVVLAYNATAGANQTLVNYVLGFVDDAANLVTYYNADGSQGFHHPHQIFGELNAAYADLLDAKAYFYEMVPAPVAGIGVDTLIIVAGAAGGIVVGLLLGVLVGRRR
jgi:formate-dependent nitrite reductase cytochrome c552 subunit